MKQTPAKANANVNVVIDFVHTLQQLLRLQHFLYNYMLCKPEKIFAKYKHTHTHSHTYNDTLAQSATKL